MYAHNVRTTPQIFNFLCMYSLLIYYQDKLYQRKLKKNPYIDKINLAV